MAILVSACILDSTCSKQLLPWTVFSVEDDRMTLDGCFEMAVSRSGSVVQEHLTGGYKLEEARVGLTRDALDRVGDTSESTAILLGSYKLFKR